MYHEGDDYEAMVSRRRKKRLKLRIEILKPVYTTHFEGSSGSLSVLDSFTFTSPVTVVNGPVEGQLSEQPGALALKQFSNRVKLGFWSVLPFEISRSEPFRLQSIDVVSGNFNDLLIDLQGYDITGVIIATKTFVTSPGTPVTVDTTFPPISKFKLVRNAASLETRHPGAVGTIIYQGGRPRPPVYTKSVFLSEFKYKL